jgi:RNA polymerase sigma factor (TIGR02999 family)
MADVTKILNALQDGDPSASEKLLPIVYEELRRLAVAKLAHERPGQTLQATALVHEAYMRLVQGTEEQRWNGRAHFFGAAAESMRRVLVDAARKKITIKRGGAIQRQDADLDRIGIPAESDELLKVDRALEALEAKESKIAKLVKLRYFAGLSMDECAAALEISIRTAHRQWTYAKAFLRAHMEEEQE